MNGPGSFAALAAALTAHADRLAHARARTWAARKRAGDAAWRSARLLWPDLAGKP